MTRRTLVQALATLCAWPFLRLRARAEAVKAIPTPAIEPKTTRIRLWDGDIIISEHDGNPWIGNHLVVATRMGRHHPVAETVFRRGLTTVDALVVPPVMWVHYDYVSGPKWWDTWWESRWDDSEGSLLQGTSDADAYQATLIVGRLFGP